MAVCFAAPVVEWLREERLSNLGPDATADAFDGGEALRRLRARPAAALEEALLDQSAMAGVGNVIKCEALFLERRDPYRTVASLDDGALAALIDRCRSLLLRNRTTGPRTSRSAFSGARLWVYGRVGKPCLVCGHPVRGKTIRRVTHYCAHCQQ